MSTVKVLHVIARMNVGGTASYVGDLVTNLPDCALATGYVQGSEIEDPVMNNLKIFRVQHMGRKISPIDDFKALLELRRIIREIKPRIVHTHTFKAGILGRLVTGDYKRVHTFHGHLFDDKSFTVFEKRLITITERFLAHRTELLISVGSKVGLELRLAGIGKNKKWVSIPPGVASLPRIKKEEARRILGLEEDIFIVGWMARMTSVKNPQLMLDVARALPDTKFALAGGGDLLEQIKLGAPANVSVIGWAEASIFWSSVDCVVSTSDNEGMPIALIEAQMAGLPVIATNVGSNSEVVQDGKTGIVTSTEINEIVSAVAALTEDVNLRISMGKAAEAWARDNFSIEKMLEAHRVNYRSCLTQ